MEIVWHDFCLFSVGVVTGFANGKGGMSNEKILYYFNLSFSPVVVLSGA
jgi:hypothetical protein